MDPGLKPRLRLGPGTAACSSIACIPPATRLAPGAQPGPAEPPLPDQAEPSSQRPGDPQAGCPAVLQSRLSTAASTRPTLGGGGRADTCQPGLGLGCQVCTLPALGPPPLPHTQVSLRLHPSRHHLSTTAETCGPGSPLYRSGRRTGLSRPALSIRATLPRSWKGARSRSLSRMAPLDLANWATEPPAGGLPRPTLHDHTVRSAGLPVNVRTNVRNAD